ncbi:MAG TPA: CvpA family protein [Candidatus Binataceae bacterium]
MNGFDYVVIASVAAGTIYGLRQGLLSMVTSVASLGAGFYVASMYYVKAGEIASKQLGLQGATSAVIGYLIVRST